MAWGVIDEVRLSSGCGWRRTKRCETGNCVEVNTHRDDVVRLRNSQRPADVLSFDREQWAAFVTALRAGDLG